MRVALPGRRSRSEILSGGLRVTIPAKRSVFLSLFLSAWLVGWCLGEIFAVRQLLSGDAWPGHLFLAAWLTMWTIGGGWAIYTLLWTLVGKEIVDVSPSALSIKRDVLGLGRTRDFDLPHIKNLRVSAVLAHDFARSAQTNLLGMGAGSIAFDYGAKTFRFGNFLDEAEASMIIADLKQQSPLRTA